MVLGTRIPESGNLGLQEATESRIQGTIVRRFMSRDWGISVEAFWGFIGYRSLR